MPKKSGCWEMDLLKFNSNVSIFIIFVFLADLFDILLPMLNIYQEYVRNHQYSLQVLANCKQNRDFDKLLKQYESNAACEDRMLETFLTYPMFQVHITEVYCLKETNHVKGKICFDLFFFTFYTYVEI